MVCRAFPGGIAAGSVFWWIGLILARSGHAPQWRVALRPVRWHRQDLVFVSVTALRHQHLLQLIGIDGLGEMVIKPGGQRSAPVLFLAPAGECDEHSRRSPGFRSNTTSDFVAAQAWHPQVDHTYVRPMLPDQFQRFGAI